MGLRLYQQRALDELYQWFRANPTGNPCIVMPTGSGKSHVIAALCKYALSFNGTRVLMLTHVKELIEQNAKKMRGIWPNVPMGIYSAGLGLKEIGQPITFGGIQSLRNHADALGYIDIVIVDEAHLINHKAQGGYRNLIEQLSIANPHIRVIGLTASPYRLGHGLITTAPAMFTSLLEPVGIFELIATNYLAPLHSKITKEFLSTAGVKKRGGEFIEKDLQAAVNTDDHNNNIVNEILGIAGSRKHWLLFCTGVDHSFAVRDILRQRGITAETIVGKTPKAERNSILNDFKAGKITALTNANVLTTGFDYPDIDLIGMLRPTMSPGLYLQMAGRGMRVKSHTDHCLVLDFAGVVAQHGPITAINPPGEKGNGEAPVKACEQCHELVHISLSHCPLCGWAFPVPEPVEDKMTLHDDDIMGIEPLEMEVRDWAWREHTSMRSGKTMIKCTYYGNYSSKPITEYFTILHDGFAGEKARTKLLVLSKRCKVDLNIEQFTEIKELADYLNSNMPAPQKIEYKKDGRYETITKRIW